MDRAHRFFNGHLSPAIRRREALERADFHLAAAEATSDKGWWEEASVHAALAGLYLAHVDLLSAPLQ